MYGTYKGLQFILFNIKVNQGTHHGSIYVILLIQVYEFQHNTEYNKDAFQIAWAFICRAAFSLVISESAKYIFTEAY